MILNLSTALKKGILLGVVFPHGITDLFHAQAINKIPELLKINAATLFSCFFMYYAKQESIIQIIFILSSIVHFRNDMPLIPIKNIDPKCTQIILSTVINGSFVFIPIEYFIAYMAFVHTPNHYKMAWHYLKKSSLVVILGIGYLLNKFPLEFTKNAMIESNHISIIAKAIVISHIIYQESFVFGSK